MDLKKFKIADLDKSQQTDAIKTELLNMIKQFVFKYRHYYPSFKGSYSELCWDLYVDFLTPKKHRDGQVYNELDRFDPGQMGGEDWKGTVGETMRKKLAAYVQRFVTHRLIDKERSSKHELTYDENFDVQGTIPLDLIASDTPDEDDNWAVLSGLISKGQGLNDIVFTEEQKNKAKEVYQSMPLESKIDFLKTYEQIKNQPHTPQNLKDFFAELVGTDTYRGMARQRTAPKEVKQISSDIDPIREDIISATGAERVDAYKLHGKQAVRVIFSEPSSHEGKEFVDNALKELGYNFYTARPKVWYYIKGE